MQIGGSKVGVLAFGVVSFEFGHSRAVLWRVKRDLHVFVAGKLGQCDVAARGLAILLRRRLLLLQGLGERGGYLLQSLVAEVALGRAAGEIFG